MHLVFHCFVLQGWSYISWAFGCLHHAINHSTLSKLCTVQSFVCCRKLCSLRRIFEDLSVKTALWYMKSWQSKRVVHNTVSDHLYEIPAVWDQFPQFDGKTLNVENWSTFRGWIFPWYFRMQIEWNEYYDGVNKVSPVCGEKAFTQKYFIIHYLLSFWLKMTYFWFIVDLDPHGQASWYI